MIYLLHLILVIAFYTASIHAQEKAYQPVSWTMVQSGKIENGEKIEIDGWVSVVVGATGSSMYIYKNSDALLFHRSKEYLALSGHDNFLRRNFSDDHMDFQRFQNCYVKICAEFKSGEEAPKTSTGILSNFKLFTVCLLPEQKFLEIKEQEQNANKEKDSKKTIK